MLFHLCSCCTLCFVTAAARPTISTMTGIVSISLGEFKESKSPSMFMFIIISLFTLLLTALDVSLMYLSIYVCCMYVIITVSEGMAAMGEQQLLDADHGEDMDDGHNNSEDGIH